MPTNIFRLRLSEFTKESDYCAIVLDLDLPKLLSEIQIDRSRVENPTNF